MGGKNFLKVGGAQVHDKINNREFLWFELATVTSQAFKYDVIKYTPYENVSMNHLKFKQAVTGATQVNSVTRAHAIYSD